MIPATRRTLLAAAAIALAAVACSSEKNVRPTIRFTSPADGSTIDANSVFLTIAVTGFTLEGGPDTGTPFHGHWHLYIDNDPGIAIVATNVAISEITPGEHHFFAELANQNDVPVSGVPVDELTLTFPSGAPGILLSLGAGPTVNSSSVDTGVSVTNFVLDSANLGAANVSGHGHYHVFFGDFGGPWVDEDTRPAYTITDLPPGEQTDVWFALANDDHTLVDPPVFDERLITVPATAPSVSILSPAANAVVSSPFEVSVATGNFSLVDFSGAPADSAGQGHYEVLVDGSSLGASFTTSGTWAASSGAHRVRVELRTNTGAPLDPPVVDKVRITVP